MNIKPKKGNDLLRLGIGNVLFVTFAAMLGIMAVIGASRLLAGKNIPVLSPAASWLDSAWKVAS